MDTGLKDQIADLRKRIAILMADIEDQDKDLYSANSGNSYINYRTDPGQLKMSLVDAKKVFDDGGVLIDRGKIFHSLQEYAEATSQKVAQVAEKVSDVVNAFSDLIPSPEVYDGSVCICGGDGVITPFYSETPRQCGFCLQKNES